uniref:Uncharacterized protein n=1 Tax=Arion vulgaris TaxID=1028688 RepID=A0A0B7BLS0_9EUPU
MVRRHQGGANMHVDDARVGQTCTALMVEQQEVVAGVRVSGPPKCVERLKSPAET